MGTSAKDYGAWVYYLHRKWNTYTYKDKMELIGFVGLMASFGTDGKGCHPMMCTLVQRSNMSESRVHRKIKRCLKLGLLKISGYTAKGVPIYDIGWPDDEKPPEEPVDW